MDELVGMEGAMVRLAATGDLHIRVGHPAPFSRELTAATAGADALLIAGDITENGRIAEVELACEMLRPVPVPIFAVLGNHDRRSLRRTAVRRILAAAGVTVLDGQAVVITASDGLRIGFAGVSGCGGGFWPAEDPDAIHSKAWNTLSIRQRQEAAKLTYALSAMDADVRVALMHFAPTPSTLGAEPLLKYWMLGNGELGRVIDRHEVDIVVHGHAHLGNRIGATTGGTPVWNVAYPVNNQIVHLDIRKSDTAGRSARVPRMTGSFA